VCSQVSCEKQLVIVYDFGVLWKAWYDDRALVM